MTAKVVNSEVPSALTDVPKHLEKCVDIDTFTTFFQNEPSGLGLILKGHHAIENYLNASLTEVLHESDALELSRIAFLLKADLLIALGLLPRHHRPLFNKLNTYRNKFAHNPHYEIDEAFSEQTSNLLQSLVPLLFKEMSTGLEIRDLGLERILLFVCWADCMHTLTAACKKNIASDVSGLAIKKLKECDLSYPVKSESLAEHWRQCEAELLKERYPKFLSKWATHSSADSNAA